MSDLTDKSVSVIYKGIYSGQQAFNVTNCPIALICIRMTVADNPLLVAIASWYGDPGSPSGTIISPIIGNTERFYTSMIHDDNHVYVTIVPNNSSVYMISVIGLFGR